MIISFRMSQLIQMTKEHIFLLHLYRYLSMHTVLMVFVLVLKHVAQRLLPLPQYNGGEWNFLSGFDDLDLNLQFLGIDEKTLVMLRTVHA